MRLPPAREGGRRVSGAGAVPAAWREITAPGGRLPAGGAEAVLMESTSGCWRTWYYLLGAAGLNVQLVSPSHARQLAGRPKAGRPKAGRPGCQRLARLAETGLLRPSFAPPPGIRALRDLARTRLPLARDRTRGRRRLEKLPEGALTRPSSAAGATAGNQPARRTLEAIAGGGATPPSWPRPRTTPSRAAATGSGPPWRP